MGALVCALVKVSVKARRLLGKLDDLVDNLVNAIEHKLGCKDTFSAISSRLIDDLVRMTKARTRP